VLSGITTETNKRSPQVKRNLNTLIEVSPILTLTISGLVSQYSALFDVSEALEQLTYVVLDLLLVQHANEQLPVVCIQTTWWLNTLLSHAAII
jgi:hypothetical protein